jgi:hypothetical protein
MRLSIRARFVSLMIAAAIVGALAPLPNVAVATAATPIGKLSIWAGDGQSQPFALGMEFCTQNGKYYWLFQPVATLLLDQNHLPMVGKVVVFTATEPGSASPLMSGSSSTISVTTDNSGAAYARGAQYNGGACVLGVGTTVITASSSAASNTVQFHLTVNPSPSPTPVPRPTRGVPKG